MMRRPPTGTIPEDPGSYQFKDGRGRVIYVGKASNLRQRLSNYFQNPRNLHPRTAQMVETAESVEWTIVRNEVEALMLEYSLIKEHNPRFNVRLRDDKSYPFLAVTNAVNLGWDTVPLVDELRSRLTTDVGIWVEHLVAPDVVVVVVAINNYVNHSAS